MSIQFSCQQCQSVLQVGDELAGRQAKCPKCDTRLTIPGPQEQAQAIQPNLALADATPEEMIGELQRRGQQAKLVLPGQDKPAFHDTGDFQPTPSRTLKTSGWSEEPLSETMAGLPADQFSAPPPIETAGTSQQQPFQLKGDTLGMTLADFKTKYARRLGDDDQGLPLCSTANLGQFNPELLSEDWHSSAGIVHARIDLPHENNSPSVAGVKTDLLLYQFVDDQLFRISAFLNTDEFHVVCDALTGKYGAPTSQSDDPRQLVWEKSCSSIEFTRGTIRPKQASLLHFVHKQLLEVAQQRTPQRGDDL